jgi:tellurite resistance protein TehA-like permease
MNPSWFLPGYSAMLTGTIASLIAPTQSPHHRLPIIISGAAYKGFGWTLSLALLVLYISRLLESGLPHPDFRPAMFIPVGSAAYTVVAFIGLARAIPQGYGYFGEKTGAKDALQAVALFSGVMLWVVAFWLFGIAVLANGVAGWKALFSSKSRRRQEGAGAVAGMGTEMRFTMAWWGFVFPNVGFTVATVEIGRELGSEAVLWVGSVMTALLVVVWLAMVGVCARAVWRGRVVFPGKDEDKDM